MKSEDCGDCPVYEDLRSRGRKPNPVVIGAFYNCKIDVIIVGHAKNSSKGSVFEGNTGKYVCRELDKYNITAYGTDMYKCVLSFAPEKPAPECRPGPKCIGLFIDELRTYCPKLVVSLGPKPSLAIIDKNVGQLPDEPVFANYYGQEMYLIAVPHPFSLDKPNLEIWNRRWSKIAEFLEGGD